MGAFQCSVVPFCPSSESGERSAACGQRREARQQRVVHSAHIPRGRKRSRYSARVQQQGETGKNRMNTLTGRDRAVRRAVAAVAATAAAAAAAAGQRRAGGQARLAQRGAVDEGVARGGGDERAVVPVAGDERGIERGGRGGRGRGEHKALRLELDGATDLVHSLAGTAAAGFSTHSRAPCARLGTGSRPRIVHRAGTLRADLRNRRLDG